MLPRTRIGGAGLRAEERLSGRLSARLTPRSGAGPVKGDMERLDLNFVLESKSTDAASLSLKLDWLAKISREAMQRGREPALAVQFVTGDGRPRRFGRWVLVREEVFEDLAARAQIGVETGL